MTIFQFYADETGTHKPHNHEPVVRVVGLLGPFKAWRVFDQAWSEVLRRPPCIRYWHTSSCDRIDVDREPKEKNQGKYLTDDEQAEKELALAAVIDAHAHSLVAINIELDKRIYALGASTPWEPAAKFYKALGPRVNKAPTETFIAMRVAIYEALQAAEAWNAILRPPGEPFANLLGRPRQRLRDT